MNFSVIEDNALHKKRIYLQKKKESSVFKHDVKVFRYSPTRVFLMFSGDIERDRWYEMV